MPITQITLDGLSLLINRLLDYDPATRTRLEALVGKRFLWIVDLPIAKRVCLDIVHGGHIKLYETKEQDLSVHLSIEASPSSLLSLMRKQTLSRSPIQSGATGCRITGDLTVLMELHAIATSLDIDWQDPLAACLGDGPAYLVKGFSDRLFKHAKACTKTAKHNAETALFEWRLAPNESQWEAHCQAMHDFAQRLDRLSARVNLCLKQAEDNIKEGRKQ
jgi:ubiquinone biosynthesis accessory factor UbiJ